MLGRLDEEVRPLGNSAEGDGRIGWSGVEGSLGSDRLDPEWLEGRYGCRALVAGRWWSGGTDQACFDVAFFAGCGLGYRKPTVIGGAGELEERPLGEEEERLCVGVGIGAEGCLACGFDPGRLNGAPWHGDDDPERIAERLPGRVGKTPGGGVGAWLGWDGYGNADLGGEAWGDTGQGHSLGLEGIAGFEGEVERAIPSCTARVTHFPGFNEGLSGADQAVVGEVDVSDELGAIGVEDLGGDVAHFLEEGDDAFDDACGDLLLIRGGSEFLCFYRIGEETCFHENGWHIRVAEDIEVGSVDAIVHGAGCGYDC